jgi:hypothetical protein
MKDPVKGIFESPPDSLGSARAAAGAIGGGVMGCMMGDVQKKVEDATKAIADHFVLHSSEFAKKLGDYWEFDNTRAGAFSAEEDPDGTMRRARPSLAHFLQHLVGNGKAKLHVLPATEWAIPPKLNDNHAYARGSFGGSEQNSMDTSITVKMTSALAVDIDNEQTVHVGSLIKVGDGSSTGLTPSATSVPDGMTVPKPLKAGLRVKGQITFNFEATLRLNVKATFSLDKGFCMSVKKNSWYGDVDVKILDTGVDLTPVVTSVSHVAWVDLLLREHAKRLVQGYAAAFMPTSEVAELINVAVRNSIVETYYKAFATGRGSGQEFYQCV